MLWLGLSACATWSEHQPLASGVVVEASAKQSYAVYLPRAYTRARRWPVIFGFSPMGRGADVTDRLAEAAEKYGYILIASNVSRNGDVGPSLEAQDAMWADAHALLSIDDAHTYATGFSGGARVSLIMAQRYPLRGIIACGAFAAKMPGSEDPNEAFGSHLPYVVVNDFGDADMNAAEMHSVAAAIDPQRHLFWNQEFVGPHAWPNATLYGELLEILELDADRRREAVARRR
jgi:dienelactone hydrolase